MIVHNITQKSAAWFAARAGKLTASQASKLITPTGKLSTQYKSEIGRIIAEAKGWQEPEEDTIETYWMNKGIELEPQARAWFEVDQDVTLQQCGFIESDDHMIGVSPDSIYYDEGREFVIPVEIKCPKPSTHIKWLLEDELPQEHRPQVHFAMAVTGAPYAWFMSYSPELRPLIVQVWHDQFTEALKGYIDTYKADLAFAYTQITGVPYEAV